MSMSWWHEPLNIFNVPYNLNIVRLRVPASTSPYDTEPSQLGLPFPCEVHRPTRTTPGFLRARHQCRHHDVLIEWVS
jgi:hypothetical protein